MALAIGQEAAQIKSRRWRWSAWLEGSPAELEGVERVIWILHPSFADPVQERTNRDERFRIDATGWGEFSLAAQVHFVDGGQETLRHELELEGAIARAPRKQPVVFVSASTADAPAVHELRVALEAQGVIARDASDVLESGGDWQVALENAVRGSDAMLVLVSGTQGPFVEAEAKLATASGVPVIPLAVGEQTRISESLGSVQDGLRVSSREEVAGSARDLSASLHRLFDERTRR